jgi:hypothetical protein
MNGRSIPTTLIILMACVGCANQQAPFTEQPLHTSTPLALETDVPVSITPSASTDVLTYTDPITGFSMDYPAGWFMDSSALVDANEKQNYVVMITSWDILNSTPEPESHLISSEKTKIDIAVVKQQMSLEEMVAQQKQQITGSDNLLFEELVILENDLQGMLWEIKGLRGPVRTLMIALNGTTVYISGYGNLQGFDKIALTFRENQ